MGARPVWPILDRFLGCMGSGKLWAKSKERCWLFGVRRPRKPMKGGKKGGKMWKRLRRDMAIPVKLKWNGKKTWRKMPNYRGKGRKTLFSHVKTYRGSPAQWSRRCLWPHWPAWRRRCTSAKVKGWPSSISKAFATTKTSQRPFEAFPGTVYLRISAVYYKSWEQSQEL